MREPRAQPVVSRVQLRAEPLSQRDVRHVIDGPVVIAPGQLERPLPVRRNIRTNEPGGFTTLVDQGLFDLGQS